MAYMDARSPQDRAKSIAGVVAVHGALAYALLFGLQATGVIETVPSLTGETVTEVPIDPPPPPKPDEIVDEPATSQSYVHVPDTPVDLVSDDPLITIVDDPLPPLKPIELEAFPTPGPTPSGQSTPRFDAIAAKPSNDTSRWVTTGDYRSSWISRELTGVARFRVQVGADGRVAQCTVTGSSGHAELDRATCDLVTRRARFDPARDAQGEKAPGSYSSAVSWRLPE
ncbi:energy transducer TonB [Pelagerythrobacter sp.]|uniref:energy transducer TonB n=1 Tax=Pelagerythrobacter sp. TaxID=2800702 RepID=UPI0035AFD5A0